MESLNVTTWVVFVRLGDGRAPGSRHRSAFSWRRKEEKNKEPLRLLQRGDESCQCAWAIVSCEVIRQESKHAPVRSPPLFPAAESSRVSRKIRSSAPRGPIILLNLSLGKAHLLSLFVWVLWGDSSASNWSAARFEHAYSLVFINLSEGNVLFKYAWRCTRQDNT